MSPYFRIGQVLQGRVRTYTISQQVQETVWFAKNCRQESVIVKSVKGHPRIENERDVLRQIQHRSRFIRPFVDEIQQPCMPTTIVLKYLDSDLLIETIKKALTRREIKFVYRGILEALKVMHSENLVHTDVKLDNVLVNISEGDTRFTMYSLETSVAAMLSIRSGRHLGPWSGLRYDQLPKSSWKRRGIPQRTHGHLVRCPIYGGNFNLFRPKIDRDHEEYVVAVVMEQFRYFGPFPAKLAEIVSPGTVQSVLWIIQEIPAEELTPFAWTTEREVCRKDKDFICKDDDA